MRYLYILLFSTTLFSQQIQKVDFKSVLGKISINVDKKEVTGTLIYDFEVLQMVDTICIDAQKMQFENVFVNDKRIEFKNNGKQLTIFQNYKLGKNKLSFDYVVSPKQAVYFNGHFDGTYSGKINVLPSKVEGQIWTQGQGKYTSNWFPSFDDVNEKMIFNLDISFDEKYQVISNGILKNVDIKDNLKTWQYRMQKPMSSYLLMLAIGNYNSKTLKSKSGIPLQLFIEPEDESKFESTYKYSAEIFDFLETEIGLKYPWQIYKQIPVRDFLYAGMENTSATIFAREFVVDSTEFNDQNYIDVNAHELAHQWFGNLVTAKSGKHHWLQEGFATYFSLLTQKKILGDDYFYNVLYEMKQEFKVSEKFDSTAVLNEKASSMTFYKKGAWALFVLENQIGKKNFRKALKNYLKIYSYKSVETDNFLNEIVKICSFDKEKFSKNWLESTTFDYEKANELLLKNETIVKLFDLQKIRIVNFALKKNIFADILKTNNFYSLKNEVLFQLKELTFENKNDLLDIAFDSTDLKVREILANSFDLIPESIRLKYESLLNDNSYEIKEIALLNLIRNFPEKTSEYLKLSKKFGSNNTNFRIFWLFNAIKDASFEMENRLKFQLELIEYSNSNHECSIRQNALNYLLNFDAENPVILEHLVNATTHYKWQFSGFAKTKIRNLLKEKKFRLLFQQLLPKLSEKETTIVTKLMNEK